MESKGDFLINSELVAFKLLDVSLGLGLRVYGDRSDLEDVHVESVCRKKFSQKKVTVTVIYKFLLKHCESLDVKEFCRLYILLGIYEFLLTNRNGIVFLTLLKL